MSENDLQESRVDEHLRENRTDEAVQLLYRLILSHAEKKNFQKAEALYEKLYEADPMALTEIVRAGEAIEEAKSHHVDSRHRDIWAGLYEKLEVNEANALYYSMDPVRCKAGEVIIGQGQISSRLYFIDNGSVNVLFSGETGEQLITSLGAGDFFGHDQFFSATVSTTAAVASTNVKVSSLERTVTEKWKTGAPALESKLFDYCRKHDRIKTAMAEKDMERRKSARIVLSTKIAFRFFDASGKKMGKNYKGEAADISEGGLSFYIKTSRPEAVRMMLGRRIVVTLPVDLQNAEKRVIEKTGRINAVQSQMFDDFSIHVKFDNPLEGGVLKAIAS